MNRAALPQAGEITATALILLTFQMSRWGWARLLRRTGRRSEYYVTVGFLTKTLTCRQRGDAYSAG